MPRAMHGGESGLDQANPSASDPFNELATAFSERLQELKRFTYLRIEGVHQ